MQIFLSAFEEVPDPRASNSRHDLRELLVIAFVSVLCGSTSCAEMAAFGRAKERLFRDFVKLKHAIPSHDTFFVSACWAACGCRSHGRSPARRAITPRRSYARMPVLSLMQSKAVRKSLHACLSIRSATKWIWACLKVLMSSQSI